MDFLAQAMRRRQMNCPYCRSVASEILSRKYVFIKVRRCTSCGLSFTDPIYRSSLASNIYDKFYLGEGSTTEMPGDAELEELKRTSFTFSDKAAHERLLGIREIRPGGKLLEFGCSWGYFLFQAAQFGYQVVGIEIGSRRRSFGVEKLGLEILENFAVLGSRTFDILYTAQVLEHLTDLSAIFDEFSRHLVPGGDLLIEVPNFDFDLFGKTRMSIVGAVHPLGFSSQFFEYNLPRHGFGIKGFFDTWSDLPRLPRRTSCKGNIVVWSKKSDV